MVKKLILSATIGFNLIFAVPVLAQADFAPEFNNLCWKCRDCKANVSKIAPINSGGDGCDSSYFIQEAPCAGGEGNDAWGKCLAAGQIKTKLSFGGQNTFKDLGEFIKKNYNFAISTAAILAVIVIIMSGFQWSMSAGSPEIISKSKHRIGNALIGLSIAYASFFILNTINPDLVELKLPPIYMLRPFSEIPKFCYGVKLEDTEKDEKKFYLAASVADQKSNPPVPKDIQWQLSYNEIAGERAEKNCGNRYFFDKGGSATCFGGACDQGQMCSNIHLANIGNTNYECEPASIIGRVAANYVVSPTCPIISGFEWPYLTDQDSNNGIYKICWYPEKASGFQYVAKKTNNSPSVTVVNNQDEYQYFLIGPNSGDGETCDGFFMGYAVGMDLNVNCTPSDSLRIIDKFGVEIGKVVAGGDISGVTDILTSTLFTSQDLIRGSNVYIELSSFKN